MISSRALGLTPTFRQAVVAHKSSHSLILRTAVAKRGVQTQSLPPSAAEKILNEQRLKRPSSPHFTIYQPQLTWLGSIANRVTGAGLSVLMYGYCIGYLVAPETFASANVIELAASMPEAVKIAGKTILAAPFAFHSWNGIRHLGWDMTKFITLKGAYQSGYAVLAATAVSTVALVLM
ncbi:uncharacterized protein PHACADRAFT_251770 [Phanerochaete carnosa HHB-10118-sp]|uniref:Succinate dehydrogenase cytochrome b560 subunit n=1 Tax=Phanerochaete carnosa (strain HHB-10118-sp) TaxID=650164 RepID=K5WF33_PHACS|nr:uncharacterized protein PHACADRAFT_251770 [Phanerochaete carnosa HHB-10118-sp]EKM57875.1 hypothetical protein PHACADRAFT_251770 [Phanerochaete carnosa HHB-10118-sp]